MPDCALTARILDNLEDGILALDTEGRVILCNPAAQAFTGLSERRCRGRLARDLFAGQDALLYLVHTALADGRSISDHENITLRRSSGSPLPVGATASPIFTGAGVREGAVLILRDLSRVRELEEAVRRADRLSMLGTLAAGLAHEIKNPLGGIRGAAQLLARELPGSGQLQEYTRVMVREVDRVNGIIEELLDFSRPRPPAPADRVHLAKVLGDIVLLQKEAQRGKEIDFVLCLDPSIPPILGDENLLTCLFLNLIKNAVEAIEGGGRVDIITRVASEYHLTRAGDRPTTLIVTEIRDTGRGIGAEEREQIFTPFYTTKAGGSGLGLTTCQRIVTEHGGFIKVESEPGAGTTFAVSLPFLR